jgi:hypothetical protein
MFVVVGHWRKSLLKMLVKLTTVLFVLPYGFHIKIVVGFDGEDRCNEVWFGTYRTAYGIFTTLSQFVVPFTTITGCKFQTIFYVGNIFELDLNQPILIRVAIWPFLKQFSRNKIIWPFLFFGTWQP